MGKTTLGKKESKVFAPAKPATVGKGRSPEQGTRKYQFTLKGGEKGGVSPWNLKTVGRGNGERETVGFSSGGGLGGVGGLQNFYKDRVT